MSSIWKELEKGSLPGVKRCMSLFPNSVNQKKDNTTPLHYAVEFCGPAFVKELLLHGAAHDNPDAYGNLPLHVAADKGSLESVTELLTGPGRKLAAKTKNRDGQAPLHLAVRNGHVAVAAKLLEAGARTDAKDKAGNTPLELVPPDNERLLELLLGATPTASMGSTSLGFGVAASMRVSSDAPLSAFRAASMSQAAATPATARPSPVAVTPLPLAGRGIPSAAAGAASARTATATPAPAGKAPIRSNANGASAAAGGPTASVQLAKHDLEIQALQADVRAAAERLSAVDACTAAQLESASQLQRAIEACGSHGRQILELESRVGFQEDRSRDSRSRLERLEEGERALQDTLSRLTVGTNTQLRDLSEQVARRQQGPSAEAAAAATSAALLQQQQLLSLQTDVATLRGTVDMLVPAGAVAAAASAEARGLAGRLDVLQQQVAQQQAAAAQQGGSVALEQHMQQLQAQVQVLQLPVASLTQQCAELSGRVMGLSDWQAEVNRQLLELSSAQRDMTNIMDTAAKSLQKLQEEQEEQKAVLAALKLAVQREPASAPPPSGTPQVPSTPNGPSQRSFSTGGLSAGFGDQLGATPGGQRSLTPSLGGSIARDEMGARVAELRTDVTKLQDLVHSVRQEAATEIGAIRREWQKEFALMQDRFSEQAQEARSREAKQAKFKAELLDADAQRQHVADARADLKIKEGTDKLTKMVQGVEHKLSVLEDKVQIFLRDKEGASAAPSPSASAVALTAGPPQQLRGKTSTPRGGVAGPVSENRFCTPQSRFAPSGASSLAASPLMFLPARAMGVDMSMPTAGAGPREEAQPRSPAATGIATAAKVGLRLFGSPRSRSRGSSGKRAAMAAPQSDKEGEDEEWWRASPVATQDDLSVPATASSLQLRQGGAHETGPCIEPSGLGPNLGQRPSETQALVMGPHRGAAAATGASSLCHYESEPRSSQDPTLRPGTGSCAHTPTSGACRPEVIAGGLQAPYWQGRATYEQQQLQLTPDGASTPVPLQLNPLWSASALGAGAAGSMTHGITSPSTPSALALDPAVAMAGPSQIFLPPAAHAMLTPSLNFQGLAAAAQNHMQQGSGRYAATGTRNNAAGDHGTAMGGAGRASGSQGANSSRKEPPACLYCAVQ